MKSVIIYTYYQSHVANYNLDFFIKRELSYKPNIDYMIIINGFNCPLRIPKLDNLTVLKRENIGFDFGGHNHAIQYLETHHKQYDYYFFMNSGVFGPVIKGGNTHWSNLFINKITDKVKLVSTTIVCLPKNDNCGYGPKVEGFFFMTDKIGLDALKREMTIFCDHNDFGSAIINGEYGLSRCIFKNGFTIDCMLNQYKNIDWTNSIYYNINNNKHPSRHKSFFGNSLDPYEVVFHKWFWKNNKNLVSFDIIKKYVNDFKKGLK